MSTLSLRIRNSLHHEPRDLAQRDGVSINQEEILAFYRAAGEAAMQDVARRSKVRKRRAG